MSDISRRAEEDFYRAVAADKKTAEIEALKKQNAELAAKLKAMARVARVFGKALKPLDPAWNDGDEGTMQMVEEALSLSPATALSARDQEVRRLALEEAIRNTCPMCCDLEGWPLKEEPSGDFSHSKGVDWPCRASTIRRTLIRALSSAPKSKSDEGRG